MPFSFSSTRFLSPSLDPVASRTLWPFVSRWSGARRGAEIQPEPVLSDASRRPRRQTAVTRHGGRERVIPAPVVCVCERERDCKEKLVRARRSPRVRLHRCFNLIHPVEEWESTVDTTERYTLRPAMAVDGKSADWNNPTSRTHFPCHSSVQHSHTRFIPHTHACMHGGVMVHLKTHNCSKYTMRLLWNYLRKCSFSVILIFFNVTSADSHKVFNFGFVGMKQPVHSFENRNLQKCLTWANEERRQKRGKWSFLWSKKYC